MKAYNLIAVSLIVILIGVGGFAILGRSDLKTPEVIIVGSPSEIPTSIRSTLPTGYKWQVEKDIPFDITDKPNDPRALFALDENTNKEAIDEIMEWASKNGKQEVYFFYTPRVDPDEWVRSEKSFDAADLFPKFEWPDLRKLVLPYITTPNAWAAWVVAPPEVPCVHGCMPSNHCVNFSWPSRDDDPTDGRVPSLKLCYKFATNDVYRSGMQNHILNNAGVFLYTNESNPASVIDYMKFHNGATYINRPVGLTINLYRNKNVIPCTGACGCAVYPQSSPTQLSCKSLCHCTNGSDDCTSPLPTASPLKSYDGIISIAEDCERESSYLQWRVSRHELMHLYDFGHCHFDTNKKFLRHCIGFGTPNVPCGLPNAVQDQTHIWF